MEAEGVGFAEARGYNEPTTNNFSPFGELNMTQNNTLASLDGQSTTAESPSFGREETLAPWAMRLADAGGRAHNDSPAADRNEFQRDQSRIIHSTAFRKLQYKTQVFTNTQGDLFRTRLTHSMEVAQISGSVARALRLNEDLAETLGLAHDIGHAPFGHLGQDVLQELMRERGGDFEHNLHGIRIVDTLERPYIEHDGMNLLFATREGILKHCSAKNARKMGQLGERFIKKRSAGLEAQIVDWCDALAYTHSDLEDGIREGVLSIEQSKAGVPAFAEALAQIKEKYGEQEESDTRVYRNAINLMMKRAISDLISATANAIAESGVQSVEDVRSRPSYIAGFSPEYLKEHLAMKKFLSKNLYHHPDVSRTRGIHREMLEAIFLAYEKDPRLMNLSKAEGKEDPSRVICDHVAGMTDRFVIDEFRRINELKQSEKPAARSPKRRP
jgi:dGTPase